MSNIDPEQARYVSPKTPITRRTTLFPLLALRQQLCQPTLLALLSPLRGVTRCDECDVIRVSQPMRQNLINHVQGHILNKLKVYHPKPQLPAEPLCSLSLLCANNLASPLFLLFFLAVAAAAADPPTDTPVPAPVPVLAPAPLGPVVAISEGPMEDTDRGGESGRTGGCEEGGGYVGRVEGVEGM